MTRRKRRDSYRGQIDDFGDRGALAASRDLYTALVCLTGFANTHRLRDEPVEVGRSWSGGAESVETMTVGQLLRIASDAYNQSINEVVFVYRQLLENADAADALAQVFEVGGPADFSAKRDALNATLNQRPLAKRGLLNAARRELAAREVK